jgi:hypothetical protein
MRKRLVLLISLFSLPPAAAGAAELVLDGLVARVTVMPEARSDFDVEVRPGTAHLPPVTVTREGGRAVVTGGVEVGACAEVGGRMRVGLRGGGEAELAEAPEVIVRAPRTFSVSGSDSGLIGEIGQTDELDIRQGGCGIWDVADVEGTLRAQFSGGARLTGDAAGAAQLGASGGGLVTIEAVADLVAEASGGGVIRVGTVRGDVEAIASGGGRIEIAGGEATTLRAEASGGGRVVHGGTVGALSATATGGGQIEVAEVESVISRSASGGGQVVVGD